MSTPLPSPDERPTADVVVFDGHCKFCVAQVQRLARWDWTGRLAFVSLHNPEVQRRWPELSHQQLMDQMYLIDRSGNKYAGADAFRYLSRHMPALWPLCPPLHLPGSIFLWRRAYRKIANLRYRIKGRQDCSEGTCDIHFRS